MESILNVSCAQCVAQDNCLVNVVRILCHSFELVLLLLVNWHEKVKESSVLVSYKIVFMWTISISNARLIKGGNLHSLEVEDWVSKEEDPRNNTNDAF